MQELVVEILQSPVQSFVVILNLILIESLLSIDNAAVLATMVLDLPKEQRQKALKYGILGAYIFRGICLVFAAILIQIWWLKPLGGLYLLYLAYKYFKTKSTSKKEDDLLVKENNWIYRNIKNVFGTFWSTVATIELMDLAFSIDNVFAAVAFTDNIILVWIGVFIGILAMRFVAQGFVKLLEKYPFLESSAFLVIAVLGLKLSLSILEKTNPDHVLTYYLSSHSADIITSISTVLIFTVPIITSLLFNYPKNNTRNST